MGRRGKIKKPQKNTSPRFTVQEPQNYELEPAIFSLERVQPGKYCLSHLDQENKAKFSDAMYKRRSMTWAQLKCADRHKLGCEKITRGQITAPIPRFITDDVGSFLVFRYHELRPMVGYRSKNVFYVLWFDHDYTLYDHGF